MIQRSGDSSIREVEVTDKKTPWNVYVLRQEYNKYQKKWVPCILFWNGTVEKDEGDERFWVEGLFTETGKSFYYTENVQGYYTWSSHGVSKCDPEDVKRIVDYFLDGENKKWFEVRKLNSYRPHMGVPA